MTRLISIFFGAGLLRPAPGTWGSLAALIVGWAIEHYLGFFPLVAATIIATVVGFWAVKEELKDRPGDDPSEIVIDEVAGLWVAFLFPAVAFWSKDMSMAWPAPIAAFLLFRLFDITKPWLVGRADRRHDYIGVMLDDIWAGVFAGVGTIVTGVIWHAFFL